METSFSEPEEFHSHAMVSDRLARAVAPEDVEVFDHTCRWISIVGVILGGIPVAAAADSILYDIDFGTPTHTVGAEPSVGTGPFPREVVTEIVFGSPAVTPAHGPFVDESLFFNGGEISGTGWAYEQILLAVSQDAASYRVEFDLYIESLSADDRFSIHLDSPVSNVIAFMFGNTIRLYGAGSGPYKDIGTFSNGDFFSVAIDVNVTTDTMFFYLNGALAGWKQFAPMNDIEMVRFSLLEQGLDGSPPDGSAAVALDNIVVSIVPEPHSGVLAGIGMALLACRKARAAGHCRNRSN